MRSRGQERGYEVSERDEETQAEAGGEGEADEEEEGEGGEEGEARSPVLTVRMMVIVYRCNSSSVRSLFEDRSLRAEKFAGETIICLL